MSNLNVTLGATYRHDATGTIMKAYAASAPEIKDYVKLIIPEQFGVWPKMKTTWEGTWREFSAEWTMI